MKSRSLCLLPEGLCCLIMNLSTRAGFGYISVLCKRWFLFSPFLVTPAFCLLDIICRTPVSTMSPDQWLRVCMSFHLFSSLDASRHWTRCLLACAMLSVHHCSSIFMLAFLPITIGCPISLCFSDVKASKWLVGFLRFLRLSVLETFTVLWTIWCVEGNNALQVFFLFKYK